jgi:hypothetical protein
MGTVEGLPSQSFMPHLRFLILGRKLMIVVSWEACYTEFRQLAHDYFLKVKEEI